MTFDPDDILRRFHRILVREIQATNPENLTAPFSVAEIYQNLVPYRTHRDEIGVEMNADYEHALLRLLAGEHDYLTLESRSARQEIQEELDSPNPNTGLYRDFAAADVRLNPDHVDDALSWVPEPEEVPVDDSVPQEGEASEGVPDVESEEGPTDQEPMEEEPMEEEPTEEEPTGEEPTEEEPTEEEESGEEEGVKVDEEEAVEEDDRAGEEPVEDEVVEEIEAEMAEVAEVDSEEVPFELSDEEVPVASKGDKVEEKDVDVAGSQSPEAGVAMPETCAWCREALPQRPGVNFCPFCGCSVHLVPCPECGEELELTWRFCIACGTEVSS